MASSIEESANVCARAMIGEGSPIWHVAQLCELAVLGDNCVIGRGAHIESGVRVGANSKIQNLVLVYEPAELAAGVFIGPAAVITNVQYPHAVNGDGSLKSADDREHVGVSVKVGASVGARARSWCGTSRISRLWPVCPPAGSAGWTGRGRLQELERRSGEMVCPRTGEKHRQVDEQMLEEIQ